MGAYKEKETVASEREEKPSMEAYSTTHCPVFPGISIVYQDSHMYRGKIGRKEREADPMFQIFHCREGRMECSIGKDFCYISPGDLLIVKSPFLSSSLYFPLRHYHGIEICIDTEKAPNCLSCFLSDVSVQPKKIEEKFCGEKNYCIVRSNPSFEHIFSELYNVPAEIRLGYSKIKILELMLFLSVLNIQEETVSTRSVSPYQVLLAKRVAEYLMENMYQKSTLEKMTKKFHVSGTAIKNAFKMVYGVSFYAYIKTQKMESAAYMLEYTDKTVIEIANEHGYDNSSKFAAAFRSVKGAAPGEYRARNTKRK